MHATAHVPGESSQQQRDAKSLLSGAAITPGQARPKLNEVVALVKPWHQKLDST